MNAIASKLARLQTQHPWRFVAGALLILVACVWPISELGLNGDLTALLPTNARSVLDGEAMSARFASRQTFAMVVSSEDQEAMHRFTRELVPALEPLRDQGVVAIDWNIGAYAELVEHNRGLYAELEDLESIREAMNLRHRYEMAQANPFEVWLDDDPGHALEDLLSRLSREAEEVRSSQYTERYPDGFFTPPDGGSVVILMRTDISGGAHERMLALIDRARELIEAQHPTSYADDLRVDLAGGVLEMHEEQQALASAAVLATSITLGLIMIVVLAFFRRGRAVVILPLGLLPAIALTFASAEFLVDYLNASSAFLSSIVIGNGINAHIIWLARYFELRRRGTSVEDSVEQTHRSTGVATLTASLAAGVAYGSLVVTDFRAFRDFGVIGGIGMMLCWLAAMLFTPALTVLWDRWRPLPPAPSRSRTSLYGRLLALPLAYPRVVLAASLVLGIGGAVVVARWVEADPFEYDFRNMQSQRPEGPLQRANRRVGNSVDQTTGGGAIAIMTGSPEDTPHVLEQLLAREHNHKDLFFALRSVQDLLPRGQAAKVPVLSEIRRIGLLLRPHVDDTTRIELDRYLPPDDLRALTPEDLPETIQRPFRELDGTVGAMVYAEAHPWQSQSNGRYLLAWTAACRSAENLDGSAVSVAGAAPIVADLVSAITRDGPKAVLISFIATVLLILLTFGRMRDRALTLASHLIGIVWMVAALALIGMKINFLNFVALPITFGNGVDYSVNVMRRFQHESESAGETSEAVGAAVRHTGGAVLLCSLTTVIGYLALYASPNQGLNSFGIAMSISEVTCVAAALIALPAALRYRAVRTATLGQEPDQPSAPTKGT